LSRLASIVTGRRMKWVVILLWVVAFAVMSPLGSKLADETQDDTTSFLPESAESTEVVRILDEEFPGGETTTGLIVYQDKGGIDPADRQKILDDAEKIEIAREDGEPAVPLTEDPQIPFQPGAPPGLVSEDGTVANTVLTVPTDFENSGDWGKAAREIIEEEPSDGMTALLSGDLGFSADAEEVFGEIDTKLLTATVILVLVLLGAIYRAVLVALTPLIVVFFAYSIAQGFIYLLAKGGATVSSNSTSILVVLLFGVGTDYCLLLVSRYREELHHLEDKHEAMSQALRRSGPAILASGLTVALAMLVLTVADSQNTSTLGPVAAIGVTCAFIAGLTLLPALLTIFGRKGFWPRRGAVAYDPDHALQRRAGIWRRVGDKVLETPAQALFVTLIVFGAGALGLFAWKVDYSITSFFKKEVDAVEGFEIVREAFPAGTVAPMTVVVTNDDGQISEGDVRAAIGKVTGVEGVAGATPTGLVSKDKTRATIDVVLENDPLEVESLDITPGLRDAVHDVGPGVSALVGGSTAINYDFDKAVESDFRLIAPLALLVIFVILAILLRALIAPLVLIGSVIISYLATLGISILFIRYVVGDAGLDASIPTFAFIFLVSLGIDYTIFLMARVREEARQHGTREGMLRALSATGPVITSAGIILAGTFSVLMTLPVTFTFDLGFMVALGILLDTFIVRTIMVPAAVELIGDVIWWPSTAQAGGALREETGAEPGPEPAPGG
jgi:putative drug exporter of the RND superfamily